MKLFCLAAIVALALAASADLASSATSVPGTGTPPPTGTGGTDPQVLRAQYETQIRDLEAKIARAEATIAANKKRISELQSLIKRLPPAK
jgi:hypothetical protein